MTFKYKVLITAPPILPKIMNYKNIFDENNVEIITPPFKVVESLNEDQLISLLTNINGILCGDDQISEKVLQSAKKLKVISKWGTGIDSIDKNSAEKLDVQVLRVKDIFSEPVSDTVLAYILLFSRNIIEKNNLVQSLKWEKTESYTLKERSLGIIGLGHIGKIIAKKALSLGMEVFGYDILSNSLDSEFRSKINLVDLNDLLKRSDFVTIHTDLNESSYHIINKNTLKLMKPNSVIINTSRGEVINQSDLEVALEKNQIFGAALDVFEVEPLPKNSKLRNMKNVLLSPHNSNASPKVFNEVDKQSIKNLFKGLGL
jgi:D-3-phosphoglycerate dehydrogenase / 2-oxoglutarate reductase